MRRATPKGVLLGVGLCVATACATPVGVKRVDPRQVHRAITANVLSTGKPSNEAIQGLRRTHLEELFRSDPEAALAGLHARTLADPTPRQVFALAELSFYHAENGGGRKHFLAAALYAYAFLFPPNPDARTDPLDARYRLAADLYNRAITAGLKSKHDDRVDLSGRVLKLPFGELALESRSETFVWAGHRLEDFVPSAELEVRGLRDRHRQTGLGAPMAARIGPRLGAVDAELSDSWLPRNMRVNCTAVLRFETVREQIKKGEVHGTLDLYVAGADRTTEIHGREVPLEYEPTAALAYSLAESRLWDLEITAFRGAQVDLAVRNNLMMLAPHRRGRIPLVMVHGTASSPARWGETINEIWNDPRLNAHFEPWLFFYNTGQPILYSASQLRFALKDALETLDLDGTDPGLQQMIVMGHSQGGLLTKLMAVESGDRFWANVTAVPIDELDLDPETYQIFSEALFFEPVRGVRRVIFMSTPHGGSFLAGRRLGYLAGGLVKMPVTLGRAGVDLFQTDEKDVAKRKLERLPSSIDNMRPGDPFLVTLHEIPLDERVTGHSIVAVRSDGPVFGQHDGVVAYESAHIEGVASEKVVISGHSVQGHPDAVAEVRRILLLHLDEMEAEKLGGDSPPLDPDVERGSESAGTTRRIP